MISIGKYNSLEITRETSSGVYLKGDNLGEILLPQKFVPKGVTIHDKIKVFIYFDSEDRIIATTQTPFAQLNDYAFLKVIDVNSVGAFLNWGLDKDLLVPRAEQQRPMEKDKSYLVYVKQDNQNRLIASSKLDHFLDKDAPNFKQGEKVNLLIAESTHLGTKVIINNSHWGLIHSEDIFQPLNYGAKMQGFIKTVREDGKIDVVLRKQGQDRIHELAMRILKTLEDAGGFLPLHDKSPSLDIKLKFGDSKKSFKAAIGHLYKRKEIYIEEKGIRLRNK